MAPRAKASDNPDSEPPRRSTRIAAIPVPAAAPVAAKPARKASNSKKREAETSTEDPIAESSTKKVKADSPMDTSEDSPDLGSIDIGDSLPTLTLKNEKDEDIQIADLTNEKGVVLFLVPKADTAGCTTQACGFRDIYPDFTSSNFDVYCLSADSSTAQSKWQTKKELPYPLISDPKRILISALGAAEGGKTKRSHFVFAKGGKLVDKKNPVKPGESPQLALEFVKSLQTEERS